MTAFGSLTAKAASGSGSVVPSWILQSTQRPCCLNKKSAHYNASDGDLTNQVAHSTRVSMWKRQYLSDEEYGAMVDSRLNDA